MVATDSIYSVMLKKMLEEFENFGLTPEQKAELTAKTVMDLITKFEQYAESSARELISLEHELPVKDNQALEIKRKTQYYDDRLLETVVEKQAELASFATNANALNAKETIKTLKEKMKNIEERVVPVDGSTIPEPVPIVPVPTGLNVVATSDTTLTISWQAVPNATVYALFQDGIQISSSGSLSTL